MAKKEKKETKEGKPSTPKVKKKKGDEKDAKEKKSTNSKKNKGDESSPPSAPSRLTAFFSRNKGKKNEPAKAKGKEPKTKVSKPAKTSKSVKPSKPSKSVNGKDKKSDMEKLKEIEEQEREEMNKQLEKEAKNMLKLALAVGDSNHKQAMEYFERSKAAEEELNGPISAGVALVLEKIGDAYKMRDESALAIENYEKALSIFHMLETGENFKTGEDRQNMLKMEARCKQSMAELDVQLSGDVPSEITLNSSNEARVRKPLSRQYYNLLNDHSTTASLSTANSIFSDTWSLMTPQSQYPLSKKKIHPREEEKLGDAAEDSGDLAKAVEHYKTALSVLVRKRKPSSSSVIRVQIKIADTMLREGAVFQGIKVYGSIADYLEVKRRDNVFFLKVMVPAHSHDRMVTNDFLRDILSIEKKGDKAFKYGIESGNFMEAATFYNRALKSLYKDKTLKPGNKHILRIHVKLGNIKWMMDENGSIVKAYDKAVAYFERKGDTLYEKKDLNNALYCYCQALRFLFKIVRPESDVIVKLQVKVAALFFHEGESLSALSLYRDALNYVTDVEDTDFYHNILTETIKAHEDVGEGCIFEDNPEGALFHYQEMLNFYKTGSWSDEEKRKNRLEEARILEKIGDIHIMMKHFDEAEASYAKANEARTIKVSKPAKADNDNDEENKNENENGNKQDDESEKEEEDPKEVAALSAANFHKIGFTYEAMENFDKAEEFYTKAIDLRKKWFGAADGEVAKFTFSMNSVELKRGNEEAAFEGFTKVLEVFEIAEPAHVGVSIEHVNTLKELAIMHLQKNDKGKAFEFYAKQLDKLQRCKATTLKDIVDVLRNMANLLISIGNIEMALKYFELELDIKERSKRVKEDDLAETHQAVGNCYAELGNHKKALQHFQKGVYDDAAGQENLLTYNKIGIQLAKLHRYDEALKFHQTSVLYLHTEEDQDVVKMTYNNLANAYQGIMDYEKAHEYFKMAPENDSKNKDTPSYTLYNLGNLFKNQGLVDKAKKCFDDFIKFADKQHFSSGEDKDNLAIKANALNNIGNILLDKGEFEKATEYYNDSLKMKTEIFGADSEEVFGTLCNLGSVMYRLRLTDKAYNYFDMALKIVSKTEGDSMNKANVLHKLGNVCYMEKDYESALDNYKEAFVIKLDILQDDSHPEVLLTRYNIGLIFLKYGKSQEALELFKDMYQKTKAKSSEDDPEVAKYLLDIAEAHVSLEHLEQAKDLCIQAIGVFERAKLPLHHPYMKKCRKILSLGVKKFLSAKVLKII